jgi:hypothetical protein
MSNKSSFKLVSLLLGVLSCSSIQPIEESHQIAEKFSGVMKKALPPYEEGSIPNNVVNIIESILPQQFLQAAKELFTVFTTDKIIISDYYKTAKFASMKVSYGRTNAVMVLANNYNGVLQWVSADEIQIFTKNGKIIRTIGLNNDIFITDSPDLSQIILRLEANQEKVKESSIISFSDPLLNGEGIKYTYFYGESFEYPLLINGRIVSGKILYEEIYIKKLLWKRRNKYWIDPNGKVIRSRQFLNPSLDFIEMEVIKKYISK